MDNERIAKVETHVEWLVKTVSKMEPKLDQVLERSEFRWGKLIGAVLVINTILGIAAIAVFGR